MRGNEGHEPARGPWGGRCLADVAALEAAALTLGEATPDAEALIGAQGIFQALDADVAGQADLLGLAGASTLLGEESLGIGLSAQGTLLPRQLLDVRQGH